MSETAVRRMYFAGYVLYARLRLRSGSGLSQLLPAGLSAVSADDVAYLKAYQLKRMTEAEPGGGVGAGRAESPGAEQYQQVCLAVVAERGGRGPGQYNLLMYEDRDWAMLAAAEFGWRKRIATVEQTWLFPNGGNWSGDARALDYDVEVRRYTGSSLVLRALLDRPPSEIELARIGGFYSVLQRDGMCRSFHVATTEYRAEPIASGAADLILSPSAGDEPADRAVWGALDGAGVDLCTLYRVGWERLGGDVEMLAEEPL